MGGDGPALPPSVRLIRGARKRLHRRWRWLLLLVAAAVLLAVMIRAPYTVAAGETGALFTFGRLHAQPVESGLHLRLPFVQSLTKVATGEVSRIEVFGESAPALAFLSADTNLIEASVVVQYRISSPADFLFGTEDPERLLRLVVRAALLEEMVSTPVDDILTSAKTGIQLQVRQAVQARLDRHRSGLQILAVNLQSVQPPEEAAGAFRDVSDARAEAAQVIDRAEGQRGRRLRLTRGQAEQILATARTDADARRQGARGAAERFTALLASHRTAPGQTRTSLYHETLRQVLPRTRLIILPPGEAPRIDLQLLDPKTDLGPGAEPPPIGHHSP